MIALGKTLIALGKTSAVSTLRLAGDSLSCGTTAAMNAVASGGARAKDMVGRVAGRTYGNLCYGARCAQSVGAEATKALTAGASKAGESITTASAAVTQKAKAACSLSVNGLQSCFAQAKDAMRRGGRAFINGAEATRTMAQNIFATMGQSMSDMVYAIQPMLQSLWAFALQSCQQINATLANSWHYVQAFVYA
mgnify:CR=1 FL=1